MDILEPCHSYSEPALVRAVGLYPYFHVLSSADGPTAILQGREVVMMGSNNYLGLTHHPEILAAAHHAIDRYGAGCTGSRFLNGNLDLHQTLELELAAFLGKEAALVFSSGFLANAGVLTVLGRHPGSILLSDRMNHASLIEGIRLSRGETRIYGDLDELESLLAERESWPHALVVTDGVFSMTGRVVDIRRLVALKERYGFRLYVDDAHGFGVLGPDGRGTSHEAGVADQVDLIFGTFSKSLASMGGFVAGDARVMDYLRHKARTLIFSAALAPASAAAALAALRLMQRDANLFTGLWENVRYLRQGLQEIGFHTLGSRTPILPLFIGSESLAFVICRELLERGVFTTPVVHPAVPFGQALIRTSTNPSHSKEHLDKVLRELAEVRRHHPIPEVSPGNLPRAEGIDFSHILARLPEDLRVAPGDTAAGSIVDSEEQCLEPSSHHE